VSAPGHASHAEPLPGRGRGVEGAGDADEGARGRELLREAAPTRRGESAHEDLGVAGLVGALLVGGELFEELLAGAHAGEGDLDVLARRLAREGDEVAREVDDLHRLAHVEDEDLPALAHGAGLQHELAGLGDGHEVPLHLRVRHRDRPAGAICSWKMGTTEPVGAEHVAEAHGDEAGLAALREGLE
jgi:hypothetical protein